MNSDERKLLEPIFKLTNEDPEIFVNIITKSSNFKIAMSKIFDILKKQFKENPLVLLERYLEHFDKENLDFDKFCNSLNVFLDNVDGSFNITLANSLVENDIVNSLIKEYIDKNIRTLNYDNLSFINNTNFLLVQAYCSQNNIEIMNSVFNIEDYDNIKDCFIEEIEVCEEDSMHVDGLSVFISNIPKNVFSREEELEIFEKYEKSKDPELKKQIMLHNLKWVIKIARRYQGRGLDLDDLIEEGILGLFEAIDKFDYKKGNKFTTYSTNWIFQKITRAIADNGRTIRIPVHMVESVNKYYRAKKEFFVKNGYEPDDKYLMEKLNVNLDKLKSIKEYAMLPASLNRPVGEEEHGVQDEFGDFLEQTQYEIPEEYVENKFLSKSVIEAFKNCDLNDREKEILRCRFGLYGKIYTLEDLGKRFNITRERIRQIEAKALKKLRDDKRIRSLAEYTENPEKALEYAEYNGFKKSRYRNLPEKEDEDPYQNINIDMMHSRKI